MSKNSREIDRGATPGTVGDTYARRRRDYACFGVVLALAIGLQTLDGRAQEGIVRNRFDMQFARIEAGTFEVQHCVDCPAQVIFISKPFYMGRHEVTQKQWKDVMGTEPWLDVPGVALGDRYPASNVSWGDARAFIRRINSLDNTQIYRLPTSAEWEYAARAGSRSDYFFGNDPLELKTYAWYEENTRLLGEVYAHEVGRKRPNKWQLYDVYGNVAEWVQDAAGPDRTGACPAGYGRNDPVLTDPVWPPTGIWRRVRGGHFASPAAALRSSVSFCYPPDYKDRTLGFRVVMVAR